MLTLGYPLLLLALFAPLLVRWFAPPFRRSTSAVRVPFIARLEQAGVGDRNLTREARSWLVPVLIWCLIIVALAKPQWLEPPIERVVPTRDLLLLVDLSGSMDQSDFTGPDGKSINRLEAVKMVLSDFLMRREGDRVGLVVFGSAPFLQVPFTTDLALCRELLDQTAVGMAGPKTALGDAIGLGINLFDESDAPAKTMITLTDGNDAASKVPPLEAARIAKDREITIHTVAMGDPTTVGEEELDQQALRDVAGATEGGQFYLAINRKELEGIYAKLDEIETREVKTVSHRPRRELYFWPLGVALGLSLIHHLLTWLRTGASVTRKKSSTRLRVNTRTFDLEASDP